MPKSRCNVDFRSSDSITLRACMVHAKYLQCDISSSSKAGRSVRELSHRHGMEQNEVSESGNLDNSPSTGPPCYLVPRYPLSLLPRILLVSSRVSTIHIQSLSLYIVCYE